MVIGDPNDLSTGHANIEGLNIQQDFKGVSTNGYSHSDNDGRKEKTGNPGGWEKQTLCLPGHRWAFGAFGKDRWRHHSSVCVFQVPNRGHALGQSCG
jgi:hypothetical protein